MANRISITSTTFSGYKALGDYSLRLSHMNVLVGPNNCGKSTELGAYRVLMQGLRRARSSQAELLRGPIDRRAGWRLPDDALPISSENIHTDYAEIDTWVEFKLSNRGQLTLFFPAKGGCYLFADSIYGEIHSSRELKLHLPVSLVVVPVLGPVEHQEPFVTADTVRRNLITTRASRNFRNYWYRYPEGFDDFADLVRRTWPGMEIQRPERLGDVLGMFCLEQRISRELYWAGFGFSDMASVTYP